MSQNSRHLRLNLFLSHSGQHAQAARLASGQPHRSNDISLYIEQARAAEAARLDSLFLADGVDGGLGQGSQLGAGRAEPFNLFTAITSATEKIGVIMTASTTFYDPFTAARSIASLDHLSNGRAGWNIVTSRRETETRNMGFDSHPGHSQRYERAREFVDVSKKLWDSWDDDALVFDQQGGVYADPTKVRAINHRGLYFSVDGPNTAPRPIQVIRFWCRRVPRTMAASSPRKPPKRFSPRKTSSRTRRSFTAT